MNSSTDVEELAERRRDAAADRRRSKDKSSSSGSSRGESRRPVKDASAPTPTKQRTVETEGVRVPRITDSNRGRGGGDLPATGTSMSVASGLPQPQPQQRKRAQRQGTGKWTSGASVASSVPSHSDDDVANQDKTSTISRKRGGTGRWDGGDRRRSMEEGRDRRWSGGDYGGGGDMPVVPMVRRTESDEAESDAVLASSLALAEMAWQELANYRECGADEVAHESQVVVDEGDEDKVPAWRMEQIHEKKKERLMRMTPRQRKRDKRLLKRLIAQQRQIESLVSSYCPTEC